MILSDQSNQSQRWWLPKLTVRDMRLMSVLAPFLWMMVAHAAYLAFANARVGEGIGHVGLLLCLFSAMVGPYFWKIVEHTDIALCKALQLMTAFGLLTMATGWFIRLMT